MTTRYLIREKRGNIITPRHALTWAFFLACVWPAPRPSA